MNEVRHYFRDYYIVCNEINSLIESIREKNENLISISGISYDLIKTENKKRKDPPWCYMIDDIEKDNSELESKVLLKKELKDKHKHIIRNMYDSITDSQIMILYYLENKNIQQIGAMSIPKLSEGHVRRKKAELDKIFIKELC